MFGRATLTLGICPHSSYYYITSGFAARPVVHCSAVLYEQATELSQQLLLLQAEPHPAASRCVQASTDK